MVSNDDHGREVRVALEALPLPFMAYLGVIGHAEMMIT